MKQAQLVSSNSLLLIVYLLPIELLILVAVSVATFVTQVLTILPSLIAFLRAIMLDGTEEPFITRTIAAVIYK